MEGIVKYSILLLAIFLISGCLTAPSEPRDGKNGEDGTQWLIGTGRPNAELGTNRDLYLNSTTQELWSKATGTWVLIGYLRGEDGADGQDGQRGTTGPRGEDGQDGLDINWRGTFASSPNSPSRNDAYYNSTMGQSYIFDGSFWTLLTKDGVQGPQGIQGPAGTNGINGTNGLAGQNGTNGISIVWIGSRSTPPASPSLNTAYYNTISRTSYIWNGSAWQVLAQDGLSGSNGLDGDDGQNGTSINWLGELDTAPANPQYLDAYYDINTGVSYIYNGTTWDRLAG
jgi:hypothetical protein